MKKIVILIFALISSISYSQDAKALLDDVAQKVKSYDNIYIEFEHKLDNRIANLHQEAKGNSTLQGDLYHFNYMGAQHMYDGTKIYMIIHEFEEVVIKEPNTDDETSITPSKMLTFYENGFTYDMDILQNVNGRKIQFVKLTPINSDSEMKSVLLGIDSVTKHIYKVIETGKDDTVTTITISKFVTNQPISDKLFTFDKEKFTAKGYDITEPK